MNFEICVYYVLYTGYTLVTAHASVTECACNTVCPQISKANNEMFANGLLLLMQGVVS